MTQDIATPWASELAQVWLNAQSWTTRAGVRQRDAALDVASASVGEHALDVGCGTGETTVAMARSVTESGRVVGLDVSPLLLERARSAARDEGLPWIEFVEADAQTQAFGEERFDLVFSAFGVMFFADPLAAFANLRGALKDDGRLVFVCFRSPQLNPALSVPAMAASSVFGEPPAPDPLGRGPFAFADEEHTRTILEGAGFGSIKMLPNDEKITMDLDDEILGHMLSLGPFGDRFRGGDAGTQRAAREAVRDALAPFKSNGSYTLPSSCWIVSAQ